MLAQFTIGFTLVLGSFAALLSSSPIVSTSKALITPGPQIELLRKQNDLQYIGYLSYKGTWTSQLCDPGNTYYQAGGQWACCATEKAGCLNLPIGCVNGNMIYRATQTGSLSTTNSLMSYPCTSIWPASSGRTYSVCNTAFMFENERDTNPKVNIVCGAASLMWSYYRQVPSDATASYIVSPSIPLVALPVPSRVSASVTATSSPGSSATDISAETGDGGAGKSKSKAWIAGAVIGPLLGLALIGLAIFFFMRRKKNKSHNQTVAPAAGGMHPPGATAYQQNTYATNTGPHQLPQYYPNMQQSAGAASLGVAKSDGYYGPRGSGPQSPMSSQGSQSLYGAPQQWQQPGGQLEYGGPSPSMSPQLHHVQPAQYMAGEPRPFSGELQGSYPPGQPDTTNVQPHR